MAFRAVDLFHIGLGPALQGARIGVIELLFNEGNNTVEVYFQISSDT